MDYFDSFINELNKKAFIPPGVVDLARNLVEVVPLPRGADFLRIGQRAIRIAFIQEGLIMVYRLYDGIEIPVDFRAEGRWVTDMKSFTDRTLSETGIKTLENSVLLVFSDTSIQALTDEDPKCALLLKNVYDNISLTKVVQHGVDLRTLTATERYEKFVAENPRLANRIPLYYIAAHLGIRPQSLSRIRRHG